MSDSFNTDGILVFHSAVGFLNQKPITMNALESIECAIAFDVRDWAADRRSAWIYAIVFGWGDPQEDDAWSELCEKFGWDKADIDRAQMFHNQWESAKKFVEGGIGGAAGGAENQNDERHLRHPERGESQNV